MNPIQRIFVRNWPVKVVSLVLAVLVWYLVKRIVSPAPSDATLGQPAGFLEG